VRDDCASPFFDEVIMSSVTVDSVYGTDSEAHEVARLPGEALDYTGSDEAREKTAAPGTDGLFAAPDGRSRASGKNNFPLYAGVGVVALLMAAGYVLVHSARSHHPLQATQTSTVHLAGVPPRAIAPLAPSASLANVPLPKSPPAILHQKYVSQPLSVELSELDSFRLGMPPSNRGIIPPQGLSSPGVQGAPQEPYPPPTAITGSTAEAAPTGLLAPHKQGATPNLGANSATAFAGSPLKLASNLPPKPPTPVVTPTAIAPGGQVSVLAKYGATTAPQAAPAPGVPPIQTSAATLAAAQAGALSPAQQTQLLQLVTELATMERDDRIKQAVLTADVEQLSALTTNKLQDYDRRLSMLEAQTAVSGAEQVGSSSAVEAAIAPAPVVPVPAPANSSSPGVSPPQATPAKATTPTSTVLPATAPTVAAQYHVQAASPGLAMLSVVGGDGSPLEVQVGDIIPGYGKVLAVVQQGDSWIVQTQSGNIE
jgi:hypothetical protein